MDEPKRGAYCQLLAKFGAARDWCVESCANFTSFRAKLGFPIEILEGVIQANAVYMQANGRGFIHLCRIFVTPVESRKSAVFSRKSPVTSSRGSINSCSK